jgi:hypothetical protein
MWGKTFSVRQLGKTYTDFYEINFEKRVDLHSIFETNLDPVRILRDLSVDRGAVIRPGETLLFFEESSFLSSFPPKEPLWN